METNNMNIRERFEEIWPVPDGVYWMPLSRDGGEYMADPSLTKDNREEAQFAAEEWDARLDTFTRCQETTEPVMSLIQELVWALEAETYSDHKRDLIVSAKQIMEQKK